jgi:hypothetical protein
MKRQIGVWVDSSVWQSYRELCGRERVKPGESLEEFLRFVLGQGSVLAVVNMLKRLGKAEGFEAYARVLLSWYNSGYRWIQTSDEDEAPVEPMLLNALKDVSDPQLRGEIEKALKSRA